MKPHEWFEAVKMADGESVKLLRQLYHNIEDLIETNDWKTLDQYFIGANTNELDPLLMIGLLRGTFRVRKELYRWCLFRNECFFACQRRGVPNFEKLFAGLY